MARAAVGHRIRMPHAPVRITGRPLEEWLTSWVYVCIERNATAVAQQPLSMFREEADTARATKAISVERRNYLKGVLPQRVTEKSVEVMDHPFLDALEYVNPLLNSCGLWWMTVAHLLMHGVCFWKIKGNGITPIVEIWPLPPQYMYFTLDPVTLIKTYEYRYLGQTTTFDPADIIMFRKPSPIDMLSGLGNLRAMLYASETNMRMQEYESALFTNDAVPEAIISLPDNPGDAQAKTLQADVESRHGGQRNRGKIAVFSGDIRVERLGMSNKDLQFDKGSRQIVEQIAAGFGVPFNIVMQDGTTFNNMRHGTNLWTRQTIGPIQILISQTINSEIMPLYMPDQEDDGVSLRKKAKWFVSFGDPTMEDVDADSERAVREATAGFKTLNEIRRENGLDEVSWGNEPLWPGGMRLPSEPIPGAAPEGIPTDGDLEGETEEDKGPTLAELTQGIERMVGIGDEATANMLRNALADNLGQPQPSDVEVAPGVVDPEEQAERAAGIQEKFGPDESEETNGDGRGDDKEGKKKEEKPKPKDKPEDKAADLSGHEDGYARVGHLGKAVLGLYGKLALKPFGEDEFDKAFAAKLIAVLHDFEEAVKRGLESVLASSQKAAEFEWDIPTKADFLKALFNQEEWAERILKAAEPFLLNAFNVGTELGIKDIQNAIADAANIKLGTERIEAQLKQLTERFSSEVVDVQGDTLFATLSEGMQAGERPTDLFKRVADIYGGERGDANAERIVRTEMSRAMNAGAQEVWREAGVSENEWHASADACEFCLALNGQTRKFNEPFVKRGQAVRGVKGGTYSTKYGDVRHPPLHPHDTCTILPVIDNA